MHIPHSNLRDKRKRALLSQCAVTKLIHKVICHDLSLAVSQKSEERKAPSGLLQDTKAFSSKNTTKTTAKIHSLEKRLTLQKARLIHHSPGKPSSTRIQNRCTLSGRSKSVYRFCKISRIRLRDLAGKGLLNGVTKSSW